MNTLEKVKEFHKLYECPIGDKPGLPNFQRSLLRVRLLNEELEELADAIADNDLVEVLDALTDIQYILDGTYLTFGMQDLKDAAFAEVHRSNLTKLGIDGKPQRREDGKIIKGPNYQPPNLSQFIHANNPSPTNS